MIRGDEKTTLAELTEMQREQAMIRFTVLRPHLDSAVPLSQAARAAGIPVRTARRWLARYRTFGFVGLARLRRADVDQRELGGEIVELTEGMFLGKPRPSVATIHRRVVAIARERKWPSPSYSSIHSITSHLDPAMVTLTHDGQAAFRDRFELVYRHRAERPNMLWQADHTELDVCILDAAGRVVRPWMTTVIDDHSRALAGYLVFLGAPSALQTSLALRQAIWRKDNPAWQVCGIPDVLYVDHGSDFTSHHLEQVAADLHFQLVFSTVARPQGRGKVERLFLTLNAEVLPELPGHMVHGKAATPARLKNHCHLSLKITRCNFLGSGVAERYCLIERSGNTFTQCSSDVPSANKRPANYRLATVSRLLSHARLGTTEPRSDVQRRKAPKRSFVHRESAWPVRPY